MYVIKKMQLNKFQPSPVVSARELFVSLGARPATITSKDTADCFDQPTVLGASKTKLLGLADEMARSAAAKQASDGKSPDMIGKNGKEF